MRYASVKRVHGEAAAVPPTRGRLAGAKLLERLNGAAPGQELAGIVVKDAARGEDREER